MKDKKIEIKINKLRGYLLKGKFQGDGNELNHKIDEILLLVNNLKGKK